MLNSNRKQAITRFIQSVLHISRYSVNTKQLSEIAKFVLDANAH